MFFFMFYVFTFLPIHVFIHSHFYVSTFYVFTFSYIHGLLTIVQLVIVVQFTSRPGKNSNFAKYCPDPHYIGGLGQYAVHNIIIIIIIIITLCIDVFLCIHFLWIHVFSCFFSCFMYSRFYLFTFLSIHIFIYPLFYVFMFSYIHGLLTIVQLVIVVQFTSRTGKIATLPSIVHILITLQVLVSTQCIT